MTVSDGAGFNEAMRLIALYRQNLNDRKALIAEGNKLIARVSELIEKHDLNQSELGRRSGQSRDSVYQWVLRYREKNRMEEKNANQDSPATQNSGTDRPVRSRQAR